MSQKASLWQDRDATINRMKVALVHDYLREYGGAERVLEAMHAMFPDAPVYTAFMDTKALGRHAKRFKDWTIIESSAASLPFIHRLYSPLRVFSANFFEGFDLSEFDVIISSTNMYMAKAVITHPHQVHLCYCHTPPRSLYGYATMSNWKKNPLIKVVGEIMNVRMRTIDYVTAQRPDLFIANSNETKNRIEKFYRRDSIVIYPPVTLPLPKNSSSRQPSEPYYLYVNRLAYSKHPELAVKVCTDNNYNLVVVGSGAMEGTLRAMAGPTVTFAGSVADEELSMLYAGAMALLYPVANEDFGIVPVESMLSGTPVIAHRSGGPKETVLDGKTGVLFDELTKDGLNTALKRCSTLRFNKETIKRHAATFSFDRFADELHELIDTAVASLPKT